jgi:hypothetical protein
MKKKKLKKVKKSEVKKYFRGSKKFERIYVLFKTKQILETY